MTHYFTKLTFNKTYEITLKYVKITSKNNGCCAKLYLI